MSWSDHNQAYVVAELARIRSCLTRDAIGDEPAAQEHHRLDDDSPPPALVTLGQLFDLSSFEHDVLLMCAGVELDAEVGDAVSKVSDGHGPSFGLALAHLREPHWSALSPEAPLRRWNLIELSSSAPLTSASLGIDERVLHHIVGVDHLDSRLHGVTPVAPSAELTPSQNAIADRIVELWRSSALPVAQLCGSEPEDMLAMAERTASRLGLRLHAVASEHLPRTADEIDVFARLWERESVMLDALLYVDANSDAGRHPDVVSAVERLLVSTQALAFLAAPHRTVRLVGRDVFTLDVARPTTAEQMQLWREGLDPDQVSDDALERVVSHFDLGTSAIRRSHTEISIELADPRVTSTPREVVWQVCRARARRDMESLARRIETGATWDDLVVEDEAGEVLRAMVARVEHRRVVFDEWGFAPASVHGAGISALFAGPSGTGKTMAAGVIANALDLDLYAIDLSGLVSKFIGETEKNLRRVFETAEASGAILLFDEADALFGRRSEVRDSHDRYANIEVSYLLQRMESYRGIAILTTNLRDAVDRAFLRRLTFVVDFDFPSVEQRRRLWTQVFPEAARLDDDVSIERLAELSLSGASIRNLALAAAFDAAALGRPITMESLASAARREFAKASRTVSASDLEGW